MTCDLICNRSTEKYPLNGKNRLHILKNREAHYYYYYYYYIPFVMCMNDPITDTKKTVVMMTSAGHMWKMMRD